jgi:hypothetical protein
MSCVPTVRLAIENAATPLARGALPRGIVPSRKVTVPVAVPETSGRTLALKVTDSPEKEGLAEETRIVVLVAGLTFWFIGALWCGWKLPSPEYAADRVWLPAVSVAVVNCATPALSVALPSTLLPSRKVTLPVGVGSHLRVAATVAVRVTASP